MRNPRANRMKDTNRGLVYVLKRTLINAILLYLMRPFLYLTNCVIIPNRKTVVFFANKSVWGDNIAYFYTHIMNNSDYRLRIICSDKKLCETLRSIYGREIVNYVMSIAALTTFIKSYFIVISHSTKIRHFFPFYMCLSQKHVLNLWHGVPLKRLNYQIQGYKTLSNIWQQQNYSSFVVCSEIEQLIIACCFDMNIDNVIITNTPRNDILIEKDYESIVKNEFPDYKYIILYAPTWREEGGETLLFPFEDWNSKELDDALEDMQAVILVRHHIETAHENHTRLSAMKHVQFANQDRFPDTQSLLRESDILVTDYSSIYIDYLLLNRPVIYIPYDEEEYRNYRGFMIDYDDAIAGAKVLTQREFIKNIINSLIDDLYASQRDILKNRFHKHQEGGACERIVSYMRSIEYK